MEQGKQMHRPHRHGADTQGRSFRRAAHALVDDLPADATWRTLVARAEVEADIEDAALGYLRELEVE